MSALKVRGKVVEISFEGKFLRKAMKSQEIRRNSLAFPLHNTVTSINLVYLYLTCYPSVKLLDASITSPGNFDFA